MPGNAPRAACSDREAAFAGLAATISVRWVNTGWVSDPRLTEALYVMRVAIVSTGTCCRARSAPSFPTGDAQHWAASMVHRSLPSALRVEGLRILRRAVLED